MPTAISMPKLGMTMEEGTIVRLPIPIGGRVERGELVLIIESEKNEAEIKALGSGFLRHYYIDEGDTVPCGTLLGAITETEDEAFDFEAFHAAENRPEKARTIAAVPNVRPAASRATRSGAGMTAPTGGKKAVSPAAKKLAISLGFEPQDIPGNGPNGRVTRDDVEEYAAAREALLEIADGICLEVPRMGEGEPVLLLPGFGTDVSVFARQTPLLAEYFDVIGINPRGVGISDPPTGDSHSVAQAAADAIAAADALGLDEFHVIGASLGSAIAIEAALQHPDRISSLTLITPFRDASGRLEAVIDAWCRIAREASSATLAACLLPWLFSPASLTDAATRGRLERGLATTVSKVPADILMQTAIGLAAWSGASAGDLGSIATRTLVIGGADDLLTPDARAIAAAIPDSKCVLIPAAGHAVTLEAAEAVAEAILDHLEA